MASSIVVKHLWSKAHCRKLCINSVKSQSKVPSKVRVKIGKKEYVLPKTNKTLSKTIKSELKSDTEDVNVIKRSNKPSQTLSGIREEDEVDYNNGLRASVLLETLVKFPLYNNVQTKPFFIHKSVETDILDYQKSLYVRDIPSVKLILSETAPLSSREALSSWKADLIKKMGEEGFLQHSDALKQSGSDFHKAIQDYLSTGKDTVSEDYPALQGCWQSLKPVLNNIDEVLCAESRVVHPELLYHGYIDCIAVYKSQPVIIEWKKATRKRSRIEFTYDDPLQTLAYQGAVNFDPTYQFQIQDSMLVIAYTDGSPADVHYLSKARAQFMWQKWLERLRQYWQITGKVFSFREQNFLSVRGTPNVVKGTEYDRHLANDFPVLSKLLLESKVQPRPTEVDSNSASDVQSSPQQIISDSSHAVEKTAKNDQPSFEEFNKQQNCGVKFDNESCDDRTLKGIEPSDVKINNDKNSGVKLNNEGCVEKPRDVKFDEEIKRDKPEGFVKKILKLWRF